MALTALPILDRSTTTPFPRPVHPYRLPEPHAVVDHVEAGSIGEAIGIRIGDELLAIDGKPLWDVIDYRFLIAEDEVAVTVAPQGDRDQAWTAQIEKHPDETLGIGFTADLFDGIRICTNDCDFCFVYQNRSRMRKSVYIKDDDYRLSFLHGDFVTLTNLLEVDWTRILEYRLSPLYVSVHATDPAARVAMLRNEDAARLWEHLGHLLDGGIEAHTQVVLTPGINDGPILTRTVEDLAAAHGRGVLSLAIVPVGLTTHRQRLPDLRAVSPAEARGVIEQCRAWQTRYRRELGTRFVFPSDEMYLLAGESPPAPSAYEDFAQYDNGVGMVSYLRARWRDVARRLPASVESPRRATVVTGTLAAPVLQPMVDRLSAIQGVDVRLRAIANRFFGESVTVAGLVAGADVIDQLRGEDLGDALVIPSVALRDDVFIDDVSLADVEEALHVTVRVAPPTAVGLRDACLAA